MATVSEEPADADAVGDGLGAGVSSKMGKSTGTGGGVSSDAIVTLGADVPSKQSFPLPFAFPLLPHDGAVGPDLPLLPVHTEGEVGPGRR